MPPIARPTPQQILEGVESQFYLDEAGLLDITKQFLTDFNVGLGEYGHPMAMIPTFVTGVPDGSETGTFLALDLGGTNLRVCEVQLHGDQTFTLRQQKYKVSTALKTGEASVLFNYLADSVDSFLTESDSDLTETGYGSGQPIPLGLTFSFPVEQAALDSGILLTWTKGFSAKNAIGQDVVGLLQKAFDRKHMHVRCVALVNDTVGALLSRSYTAGGCLLGAIFGTGTNGAYVEDVAKITKLKDNAAVARGGKMIVNCEWGAFNNTRTTLPTTPFDNKLDRESINPRFQAFEKFISGMYLGEITRNVLLSLVDAAPRSLLFNGKSSPVLNTHYGLDTAVMSAIEEAWDGTNQVEMVVQAKDEGMKAGEGQSGATSQAAVVGEARETKEAGADLAKTDAGEGVTTTASRATAVKGVPAFPPIATFAAEDFKPEALEAHVRERLEAVREVVVAQLELEDADVSVRDAALVRWACALVAGRAAKLSGTAVAAVAVQTGHAKLGKDANASFSGKERIAVGVDGSLIQHYPNFEVQLRQSLRSLVGEDVEKATEIGMAKDGSGVGAALCALQAVKQDQLPKTKA